MELIPIFLIIFYSYVYIFMLNIIKYYCRMVAVFGSGAMFSLVSGMGGQNQSANVISSGLFFLTYKRWNFSGEQLDK